MKKQQHLTSIVNSQRHPNKAITGWEAVQGGKVIDYNNSIALLRFKYSNTAGVIFKSVR